MYFPKKARKQAFFAMTLKIKTIMTYISTKIGLGTVLSALDIFSHLNRNNGKTV